MKNTKSGSPSFCFEAANLSETRRTTRLLCCVFGNRSLGTCFQVLGNIVSCDRHSSVMPRAHATHGYEVQAGLGTLLHLSGVRSTWPRLTAASFRNPKWLQLTANHLQRGLCGRDTFPNHETCKAIDAEVSTTSTVVCWRGPCRQSQANLDDIGLQFISS